MLARRMVLVACVLLQPVSCVVEFKAADPIAPPAGKERGPCRPAASCNAGLICLSNVCVRQVASAPDDAALGDGSTTPRPDVHAKCPGGCVETLAGAGKGQADGPALQASFSFPAAAAVDSAGAIIIADRLNHRLRLIKGGIVSTLAGGAKGFTDGPSHLARFNHPSGVAVDGKRVYVADQENHAIRLIEDGVVRTIAGSGYGFADGAAKDAMFRSPAGLALGSAGELYIADVGNHRVRRLHGQAVITWAGSGVPGHGDGKAGSSRFNYPHGLAAASNGAIFVVEQANHRLRRISGGQVETLVGAAGQGFVDGAGEHARLSAPTGVAIGPLGEVYIADQGNHALRVFAAGKLSTVAGNGSAGAADGPRSIARFDSPIDVASNHADALIIVDQENHRIRRVTP